MGHASNNFIRRAIALFLAAMLLASSTLSVFPATAFAANNQSFEATGTLDTIIDSTGRANVPDSIVAGDEEAIPLVNSNEAVLDETETLCPDAENVDAQRIVAWPKEETTPAQIEASVQELASELEVDEATEILENPEPSDPETLVIIESDSDTSQELMAEMISTGLYESVDYDVIVETCAAYTSNPNDPYYNTRVANIGTWGLNAFPGGNFSAVWGRLGSTRGTGASIPIAVIDTGFYMNIADRGPNIVAGYDFGSNRTDVTPQSTLPLAAHGTGTAGLIGAATNNGIGVAGAAWDNTVIVYKVADANNVLYLSSVTSAINDVVAKKNARIINLSLGGTEFPAYLQQSIDAAVAAGILVVASAGNNALAGNPVLYPAAYGPVLSVASISANGQRSSFSTFNSGVNIAAPGDGITVLDKNNTYDYASGTSFSAPFVCAAAALVWRANPNLTAAQVKNLLLSTATPIGAKGNIYTGAGALNAFAAFELAQGLPYQPRISSVQRGPKSVSVYWSKDTSNPSPAKAYILQYRPSSSSNWASITIPTSAASYAYTVTGLADNTTYYFRVCTVNAQGYGPYSASVASTTYPVTMQATATTIKMKRGKSVVVRVAPYYCNNKKFTISWKSSKPAVATISSFGKAAKKKGKGSWVSNALHGSQKVKASGRKVTIQALKKGTTYFTFGTGKATKVIKVVVN
ncbi:MAG: S8 family serine peptidase [Coriobacteriia bacterium]|nr:S8 family serine peptidase [Coriobacteriia bacterium]MCL2537032.1 S8 family serine peptidase [Coriobacteriia bacterium]